MGKKTTTMAAAKTAAPVAASDVFPLVAALLRRAGMKKSAAALEKEAKLVSRESLTCQDNA